MYTIFLIALQLLVFYFVIYFQNRMYHRVNKFDEWWVVILLLIGVVNIFNIGASLPTSTHMAVFLLYVIMIGAPLSLFLLVDEFMGMNVKDFIVGKIIIFFKYIKILK